MVGAGIGGLAVAARLAAGGHRVTVFERAPVVGGKLGWHTTETEAGTFGWDTGPSLLTMPQAFADLFAETGDPIDAALDLQELDPIARYHFPDGTTFESCSDQDEFGRRLAQSLGSTAAEQWQRFWRRAERIWQAAAGPFLESTLDGAGSLARRAIQLNELVAIAPWRSLASLADSYLDDPRLRVFVHRYATYTGSDPRRTPAALATVPYAEMAFGGWYVRGGMRLLADALLSRCEELGVTVRTGTEVRKILADGSGVTGLLLADRHRVRADLVVANADAAHVYTDLIAVPSAARRLRQVTPSLSGFVLLLALRGRTPGLPHHTVIFPADYDAEFDAVFGDPARPVTDPTLYLVAPDDPATAPPGHEAWFVLVNAARQGVGPGAVDWRTPGLADRYANHLLNRLAARGFDVRDRLVTCEVRTPADVEAGTNAVGGSIYGTSSMGRRAAFIRPANRSVVPGLFLAGGTSHPGGGLPLVALSAQLVAGLIGPA